MIIRPNRLVSVPALLVLCLVASSAGAQDRTGDFVVGTSTKADILARFGPAAYETERSLSYYAHEMGPPPLPAWLRALLGTRPQSMVSFEFDERGVYLRRSYTGWPSP